MVIKMVKKNLLYTLAFCLLLSIVGCEYIHEPWVRSPDQLEKERSRPDQAQMELRDRLRAVQTDR
jgi:hypothetical protein